MSQPRSNHSACVHGSRVFFVGGVDSSMRRLNTIEFIDLANNERGAPIECFAGGRELPVFSSVSDEKIVIMGGIGDIGKLD